MNTPFEAREVYCRGIVEGGLRFGENIIQKLEKLDEKHAKSRYKSAIEVIRETHQTTELQAEDLGYFPTDEHMKQLDKIAYAFCGLMAGLMIAGIMVAI